MAFGETEPNLLLESISDGLTAYDADWRFTFINDPGMAILKPLGKSRDNIIGRVLWEEMPEVKGTLIEEHYRRAMREQVTVAFEYFYAPIGRWLFLRIYPAKTGLTVYFLDIHEHKLQEQKVLDLARQLKEQTELFDTTLSHIDDFAYVFDPQGRFTFVNRPLLNLWGMQLGDALGKTFFELPYPAELAARLQEEILRVVSTARDVTNITAYTSPGGHTGYYEYIFKPVFSSDGTVKAVAGSTRNITEHKRTEAALRDMLEKSAALAVTQQSAKRHLQNVVNTSAQQQRLYETVLSNTPDLIYVFDLNYRFTYANRALLSMWGRTWEESAGKRCLELGYEPWHAAMHEREIDQVVSTKRSIRGEVAFNGTNGHRFYDYIFAPVFGATGEVEAIAGTTRDVTEQRKAAGAVRLLADLTQELAVLNDEKSIIHHTVSAVGRHLGAHRCYFLECLETENRINVSENWVRDDAVDLAGAFSLFDFGSPEWWREYSHGDFAVEDTENHPLINRAAAANYAKKGVRSYAVQPVKQTGEWTVLLAATEDHPRTWTPDELRLLENVAARVWPLVERARSESALRVARDEALAASRAKDDFLAALSHELRTPLNPILLIASDATGNPQLPADIRADFETIARSVALEARLIDDLLDLTRIAHNKLPLELKLRDLHTLLAQAISALQQELKKKRIRLTARLEAPVATVLGDEVRLQQVFLNLLRNALKFTPADGHITVSTLTPPEKPGALLIEITDTGIGLTPGELTKVFNPFVQGEHSEKSRAQKYGGLGLGLAIARNIVELHDGAMTVRSPGRNQGATFVVELPLTSDSGSASVPAADFPEPTTTVMSGGRRRVLLVEDHDSSRIALARLLANRKFEVTQAASAAEALEQAKNQAFDFVISDLGLPDGNGYDLMKALQSQHGLRGIALSGFGTEDDIARSREAGFAAHLTKPVQIQALDRMLGQFAAL